MSQEMVAEPQKRKIVIPQHFHGKLQLLIVELQATIHKPEVLENLYETALHIFMHL